MQFSVSTAPPGDRHEDPRPALLHLPPAIAASSVAQAQCSGPPAFITGMLARWTIDRPIASGVTKPSLQTVINQDSFPLPPGTGFNNGGLVTTTVTDTAAPGNVVAASHFLIQLSLVDGAATWKTSSNSSPMFAPVTGA